VQGNIPGSQQHRELTQAALQSFAAMDAYKRSAAALAAPVLRMQEILRQPPSREQLEKVLLFCQLHVLATTSHISCIACIRF